MRYSAWVLWPACGLLIVANVFNIGADLGGMANAMEMGTGIAAYYCPPFFALLITGLLIWTSYNVIARAFEWLALVLFAYVITAFLARSALGLLASFPACPAFFAGLAFLAVARFVFGCGTSGADAFFSIQLQCSFSFS